MNLLRTSLFFALLLTMLWVFGLMVAYKRLIPDESRVIPTLESADAKVDTVMIKKKDQAKGAEPEVLVRENDTWYLKKGDQKIKLENFKVDQLISQIKRAQKYEEFTPSDDLSAYGLTSPQLTVILKGQFKGQDKEWKLYLGRESPEKLLVYANSTDRSEKAYAIERSSIDNLFKDMNTLRPHRVFDFLEASVNKVDIKKGDKELELKRGDNNVWHFEKPALGFAGFDNPSTGAPGGDPKDQGGVKGLLTALTSLNIGDDDFIDPGQPLSRFDLEEGKEWMRVAIGSTGTGEKKEEKREVLLVGKRVPQRDQYFYARLLGDDGVVELSLRQLEPIEKALADPGKIRSKDIAAFDPKSADVVTLKQGDKEVKLYKPEAEKDWQLQLAGGTPEKANDKAAQALVETLQGKNTILGFDDPKGEEAQKKFDAETGLDKPGAVVSVYVNALDKPDKEKKTPELKKDAKPAVTLAFGKVDGELVHVKRTLPDGTVSRISLVKTILEKIEPEEGVALAYRNPALPGPPADEVVELTLLRGKEKLVLEKEGMDIGNARWYLKDPQEPSGRRPADTAKVNGLIGMLTQLQATKWVARIDAKTDLDKYGLKTPDLVATLVAKTDRLPPAGVASFVALAASGTEARLASATAALLAQRAADKGEITTIRFGKETDPGHIKSSVYVQHSSSDTIFVVNKVTVKAVREIDLGDRSVILHLEPALAAGVVGAEAVALAGSPLLTGSVQNLDPAKVKELKVSLRTPAELRTFAFRRADKTWQDASGLQEFQLDADKVNTLVEKLARLQASRFVALSGGPRADQKLTPKEALLRLELTTDAGRTVTLWVGNDFERQGYFANSSAWPDVVFLLPATTVEPILQGGLVYFSKERTAER